MKQKVLLTVLAALSVLIVVLSVAVFQTGRKNTTKSPFSWSNEPFVRNEKVSLNDPKFKNQKAVSVDGKVLKDSNFVVVRQGSKDRRLSLVLNLGETRSRNVLLIDGMSIMQAVDQGELKVDVTLLPSTTYSALASETVFHVATECPDRTIPVLVRIARVSDRLEVLTNEKAVKELQKVAAIEGCSTVTSEKILSGSFVVWSSMIAKEHQSETVPSISLDGVEKTLGSVTEEFSDG